MQPSYTFRASLLDNGKILLVLRCGPNPSSAPVGGVTRYLKGHGMDQQNIVNDGDITITHLFTADQRETEIKARLDKNHALEAYSAESVVL